ncbi:MAG: sterol desaturase family protein [Myxococcales bacterium]|nr:sterol desaturase family protein [Myxococcales bacterium]
MNPTLIALAIPVFFLLIFAEVGLAMRRSERVYRFTDAVTDLSCGIASRMFHLFDLAVILAIYAWVYDELRVWDGADGQLWLWAGAFIGLDFLYYLFHRASHEVNLLWAVHSVHHQSEDYNLAVALRQALFSSLTSLPFYLPLALLGVPPLVFGTCSALNTLYQFWIHTELINKTPAPIEAVFNTPSHHRVHHGINPQYLDRNHAGVCIIWDRLLGTFEPEGQPVVYGLVSPLRSYNPIWANFAHFRWMGQLMRQATSVGDAIRVVFKGPAWRPGGELKTAPEVERANYVKYDPEASPALIAYVCCWFLAVTLATVALMAFNAELALVNRIAGASLVVWTLMSWGGLFEGRPWSRLLEYGRLAVLVPVMWLFTDDALLLGGTVIASLASATALWQIPPSNKPK